MAAIMKTYTICISLVARFFLFVMPAFGGVKLVRDIWVGGDAFVTDMATVGGSVFFAADDGIHGKELWKTNGTEIGTVMVKDMVAGLSSEMGPAVEMNNIYYFLNMTSWPNTSLWRSDGTYSGTWPVKDLGMGARRHRMARGSNSLAFYFDTVSGATFWVSDGTEEGTVAVEPFTAFGGDLTVTPIEFKGKWYFGASDGSQTGLWTTDGTTAGTQFIMSVPNLPGLPANFLPVGDNLYFIAGNTAGTNSLFKTDGTGAGTIELGEVGLPEISLVWPAFFPLLVPTPQGVIYPVYSDPEGTYLIADIYPGDHLTLIRSWATMGGRVFISADDGVHGYEVRVVGGNDPTAAFYASPGNGDAPLSVQFQDESLPGSAPITEWLWDFGDGETSTEQNPLHVYEETGAFTVSLTVTAEDGADAAVESWCVLVGVTLPAMGIAALLPTTTLIVASGRRSLRK